MNLIERLGRYFIDHLLYNELAWSYDLVSWGVSLGEWRAWTHAALPFVEGGRVLEVAHGPGHLLQTLRQRGYHAVGLDVSPYMGRMAQRRLKNGGFSAELIRSRTQAIPLPADQFDAVVSTFPTTYILHPQTLQNIRRVLRPNGRLIIVPGGLLTGATPIHKFIDLLYKVTGQSAPEAVAVDDGWGFWRERFEQAGFSVDIQDVVRARSVCTVMVCEIGDGSGL